MNINNSLLFLRICRDTICEIYTDRELNYFIQNEASDYQIINIIVHNEIPFEKYNIIEEKKVWKQFQNSIYKNNKNMYKLVSEMGPIIEYNLSSSKVILNFLTEVGDQQKYVQGLYNNMKSAMKSAKSTIQKGAKAASDLAVDTAGKAASNKIVVGMAAGAAATMVAFAAAKIYQQYLSKAAKACNGKPDKVNCMRAFKKRAMTMRIEKLKSGMATCNKAKNSENCQKSLQSKILKLQLKADKI